MSRPARCRKCPFAAMDGGAKRRLPALPRGQPDRPAVGSPPWPPRRAAVPRRFLPGRGTVLVVLLLFWWWSWAAPRPLAGAEPLLDRFFPPAPPATPTPALSLPDLPAVVPGRVGVDQHNEAVRLNNQGVAALEAGDAARAASLFERALAANPHEVGIWKNLLAAQRKDGRFPREIVRTSLQVMAMDAADAMAPYAAGMAMLDKLGQPRAALAFLDEAARRQPDDTRFAVALANAWNKAGFPDQALAILREKAPEVRDDPYPLYLLGTLLTDRKEFAAAQRALQSAMALDREGFAHDAYIRARFAGGGLDGLAQECEAALRRFPGIINRASLERIRFCLVPHEYEFTDQVNVQIANPSDIRSFHFLLRFPPEVPHHQSVQVLGAEIESQGRVTAVTGAGPDADGRHSFECPAPPGNQVTLRVRYRLSVTPWLGSRGPFLPAAAPDLERLKADEKLSLADGRLDQVFRRLSRESGNFLQNAFLAVGRGLSYHENFEDQSVQWALENPDACDCTEFARLLAALCLKRGIPTRVVTGFLVKEEFLRGETNIGHAWCEVFFRDKGWIPVDPTLGVNLDWAYFGNLLSDQIVFDHQSEGRKTRMGVDFTSTSSDVRVRIDNTYRVRLLR